MKPEIIRLHAGDAEECFDAMTAAFQASKPGHPHFRDILPKMCRDDDERMGRHLAIRENGRICAVLGIYPLPFQIGEARLLGTTVGNVATLPEARGKGYMSVLLDAAMEELDQIGADFSRLGGLRRRYNRYGYEVAGRQYSFSLSMDRARDFGTKPVTFRVIGREDHGALAEARRMYERDAAYVIRETEEDFYLTLIAWQNVPYGAYDEAGRMIGYLCAAQSGGSVAEAVAEDADWLAQMLCAWCLTRGASLSIPVRPWQADALARLQVVCDTYSISSPSHFLIRRWDRMADAFMKLRRSLAPMAEGEWVIGIEGWGNLRLYVTSAEAGAERTEAPAAMTVDRLAAVRMLFGTLPAWGDLGAAAYWLPLPLGWNLQDRV